MSARLQGSLPRPRPSFRVRPELSLQDTGCRIFVRCADFPKHFGLSTRQNAADPPLSNPGALFLHRILKRSLVLIAGGPLDSPSFTAARATMQTTQNSNGDRGEAGEAGLRKMLKNLLRAVGASATSPGNQRKTLELSSASLAELQEGYRALDESGKSRALLFLATQPGVDLANARELAQKYISLLPSPPLPESHEQAEAPLSEAPSPVSEDAVMRMRLERQLRSALMPLSLRLFDSVNNQRGGLKFLVDLRADLQSLLKRSAPSEPSTAALREMDSGLREKFLSWLSPATLELRQVSWNDPAALLEKIVSYEAVHPVRSLLDLRRRMGRGRRCFAFFHPAIPGEPLVFIEVALTPSISSSIDALLTSDDDLVPEEDATTAVFYSISNTQEGLKGVDLGNFLIKNVVKLLQKDLPHIGTFVTLSPMPGFSAWLLPQLARHARQLGATSAAAGPTSPEQGATPANPRDHMGTSTEPLLLPGEEQLVCDALGGSPNSESSYSLLLQHLQSRLGPLQEDLKPVLLRLGARYIVSEKKRGKALDPVANFHIRNGAMAYRLNWGANCSPGGVKSSFGIMVNYLYDLSSIERNSQSYEASGNVPASDLMQQLLRSTPTSRL